MLRAEDNRILIAFGANRPICPYHKRVHDNENMFARVHNGKEAQGLVIYCYRETQGEVKWAERVHLEVDQKPNNLVEDIQIEIDLLAQPVLEGAITTNERYVSLLPMVSDAKTIFLRSHLGTGKTEAVMRLI